jgi:hypothetical protein
VFERSVELAQNFGGVYVYVLEKVAEKVANVWNKENGLVVLARFVLPLGSIHCFLSFSFFSFSFFFFSFSFPFLFSFLISFICYSILFSSFYFFFLSFSCFCYYLLSHKYTRFLAKYFITTISIHLLIEFCTWINFYPFNLFI